MESYKLMRNKSLLQCGRRAGQRPIGAPRDNTRKVFIRSLVLLCLAAALPWPALAQLNEQRGAPVRRGNAWTETYTWTAPAREGGKLVLRADMGSVEITPGTGNQVEGRAVVRVYNGNEERARRVFDAFRLSARLIESTGVYVSAEFGGSRHRDGSMGVEFDIKVPAHFNLDVETKGGDIDLDGALLGEAKLTTAGGDIHAGDISGPVRVETAGGNISLGNIGAHAEVRTAGGNIHIGNVRGDGDIETSGGEIEVGQVDGTVRTETAGGDIVIAGAGGQVTAETAGGQIHVGPTAGSVRAQTAGGNIVLRGARGRVVAETTGGSIDLLQLGAGVRANTSAGRILAQFDANTKTFVASQLESSVGDVYVYLPINLSLTIDAAIDAAAGHHIVTDFPLSILGDKEDFSERTIRGHGTLNGGGEVLRIRTVAGNIEIRKIDAHSLQEIKNHEDTAWNHLQQRAAEKAQREREREQQRRQRQKEKEDERDEN
jgi:DUF4097 and DUF4098 domain-containing protein YvlB